MLDAMQRETQLARRNGTALSLLAMDLDNFKRVNDSHGHSTGDAVLQATAERLRTATRGTDLLFRYGGEEFVAVLAHTGKEHAIQVAERIRCAIAEDPVAHGGERLTVTISIGVAVQAGAIDPTGLFDRADQALYRAKRLGRNRVEADNR
jgi:diguanylate cyclase